MILMLITSISVEAQREEVYQNVFDTDRLTSLVLDIENSTFTIENSEDGKVHINYFIEFDNFSPKERESRMAEISAKAEMVDDEIRVSASSKQAINIINFKYIGAGSLYYEYTYDIDKFKEHVFHKSKDSIVKEIRVQKYKDSRNSFKGTQIKIKSRKGKTVKPKIKDVKTLKGTFIIKVPPHVGIHGNLKNSNITIRNHLFNEIMLDLKKGSFTSKELRNNLNHITVNDANFKAEGLLGGNYILNNVKKGLIGTVYNASIISEFSKLEIGEIRGGASVTDFNSTYWFYNWSGDFKKFEMQAEYSKVHLFQPNKSIGSPNNYMLTTFGYNTVHHFDDDTTAEIPPNRKNEKSKMLVVGDEALSLNKVHLDIVHGIVNLYPEE